ncbi:response regulator transcription factor [Natronomonas sp. LN261]|jgi:two-component system response regulator AdeR|uniref:response regulator transcription factor n=1 Tax=Natronomonas sp. LN261 TaxID=2750669 RepID=UPI0015EEEB75|nr:response regulator transcription factor [Natronomonas sp. LN261]
MADGDDQPTVLVVEDERALIELYVRWLENDFEVLTAEGGEAALEQFGEDVDVVLLDRLMPGMSGDEVLEAIRAQTSDCKVAMVTAVEPDFDVIDMGFDDYLTKPIEREELLETIDRLLSRSEFDSIEQELYALSSKQAALRASKPKEELDENEEFAELQARIDELQADLDTTLPEMGDDEFVAMVRDIEADDSGGESPDSEGGDQ